MTAPAWIGSAVLLMLGTVGFVIRSRVSQAGQEKANSEQDRQKLISALNLQTQQTLAIVREELGIQQKNSVMFFGLLDRNTSALEKMVANQATLTVQMGAVQTSLARLEGANGVSHG